HVGCNAGRRGADRGRLRLARNILESDSAARAGPRDPGQVDAELPRARARGGRDFAACRRRGLAVGPAVQLREYGTDRDAGTGLHQQFRYPALREDLDVDDAFVRFDERDDVAALDDVTRLDPPLDQ